MMFNSTLQEIVDYLLYSAGKLDSTPLVFVHNMSEYPEDFYRHSSENVHEESCKDDAISYTGRELIRLMTQFYNRKDIYFVTPANINQEYIAEMQELFGFRGKVHIIRPTEPYTGLLSKELMASDANIAVLVGLKKFDFTTYAHSTHVYDLIELMEEKGTVIRKINMPTRDAWENVKQFKTKSGNRRLIEEIINQEETRIPIAEGKSFKSFDEAVDYIIAVLPKYDVAVKGDDGFSGLSVRFLSIKNKVEGTIFIDTQGEIRKQIKEALPENFWKKLPVVVEEKIELRQGNEFGNGLPNVEAVIRDGKVKVLYYCGLTIDNAEFEGVDLGKGVLSPALKKQLHNFAMLIGNALVKEGYSNGAIDVDCLYGDKLYLGEINIRPVTGGTYEYYGAKWLLGRNFEKKHYIYADAYKPEKRINGGNIRGHDYYDIKNVLGEDLMYNRGKKSGVFVTNPDGISELNLVKYMIIARDRCHARDIKDRLYAKLDGIQ